MWLMLVRLRAGASASRALSPSAQAHSKRTRTRSGFSSRGRKLPWQRTALRSWPLSQFRHPWCPTTAAATVSGARGCPNDVHIHKLSLTHTFAPAPHSHHPHLPPTSSRDSPRHCQPKAKRPILISKTTRGQTRRDSGIAHNTKREKAGTTGVWRGSVIVVPSPKIRLPCPPGLRNSRPSAGHGLSPPSTAPARS